MVGMMSITQSAKDDPSSCNLVEFVNGINTYINNRRLAITPPRVAPIRNPSNRLNTDALVSQR